MGIDDLLNKLEAAEHDFLASEVLAPVLPGQAITVRIAGIVCQLRVDNQRFEGWALLQPLSTSRARFVRAARLAEVATYSQAVPSDAAHRCAARGPPLVWPGGTKGRQPLST